MKQFLKIALIGLILLSFSCEEVVDIPLKNSEARLVVEASLLRFKEEPDNNQQIKLSLSAPFYEEENPPVENASVYVTSESGDVYYFEHGSDGFYLNSNFEPEIGETYHLEIEYEDQLYTATETMMPVTDIEEVEQSNEGGFGGDEIEIKAYYTDPAGEDNYYLFIFRNENISLEIYEDEFNDGNRIFGFYSNEDLERGDKVEIEMYGISKAYYEYLFVLRTQIGSGGGPFETRPATVKGNVVNETNPDNYPFGYFHLSEVDELAYEVE